MELKQFIKTYDNFISPEDCDALIQLFEESPHIREWNDNTKKFHQLFFKYPEIHDLQYEIAQGLEPYIKDYFSSLGVDPYVGIQSFEVVRIKKYFKNSDFEFRNHVDVGNLTNSKRYLVCIVYLNDNDGSTTFPLLDYECKPKKGSLIMFPPNWMFPHAGKNPTDHDKYILMTYLNYDKEEVINLGRELE